MELTPQQVESVKEGKAVTLLPPEVGEECILVLAPTYWRFKWLIDDAPEGTYPAVLDAWDSAGSPDDATYT
jgi:hypothetical protein